MAAAYPDTVLTEMQAHVVDLERKQRECKPLGQRIDQARKKARDAQGNLERADAVLRAATKARCDALDASMAAQVTLEACMSEAAEESLTESDSDRELLIAAALHAMLQATESTWPAHSGAPPEGLVKAMQDGQHALSRPATPPRAAPPKAAPAGEKTAQDLDQELRRYMETASPGTALQQKTPMANPAEAWDIETDGDTAMDASIATMLARLEEAHSTQAGDEAAKAIAKETLWAFARNATKGKGKGDKGDRFEPT